MDATKNKIETLDAEQVNQIPETQDNENLTPQKVSSKKPLYKQWWFWVIIVFALLVIGAIGSGSSNTTDTDEEKTETSETTQKKTEETADNTETPTKNSTETSDSTSEGTPSSENAGGYKVGETIVFKDSKVTIMNVTRNFDTGNMFVQPENGKEYVKIDVSFVNTTTSKKAFYPSSWQLQDGDGVIHDISYTATTMLDNSFSTSVELAGGGKWSGSMIFEVPAGDTSLQLQFKPSLLSNTTVINL